MCLFEAVNLMKMGGVVTSKKFKDLESRAREEFNKEKCKLLISSARIKRSLEGGSY